jgi:hypothetical protein
MRALVVRNMAILERLADVVSKEGWSQPQRSLDRERWLLARPEVFQLLSKLRRRNTSLNEYTEGRFYRGVTTGLNDAFVIDRATRDRLVTDDPQSTAIIRPWLRGRDVKRWHAEWDELYVIFTRRGTDIGQYPALRSYLDQFKDRLRPGTPDGRKPGNYAWFEIQDSTAYYAEFETPKVIWAKYGIAPAFAYDTLNHLCGNTVFILPTDELALVGILNSRVVQWFATNTFNIVRGGYIEWIPANVARLPIPEIDQSQRSALEELVRKLLDAQGQGPQVAEWEGELNALVYKLYGLTEEEIAIVEGR